MTGVQWSAFSDTIGHYLERLLEETGGRGCWRGFIKVYCQAIS